MRMLTPPSTLLRVAGALLALAACSTRRPPEPAEPTEQAPPAQQAAAPLYEHPETRALVALVDDAARLIERDGETAFAAFRMRDSRWRQGETYVFVIDPTGNMRVHPELEGKNELELTDISGRPIIRGLLDAALAVPAKPEGWYHYQWFAPGGLLPRWKSSFVRLAVTPAGKQYVVGSGMYNDRMERAFVVDIVDNAVAAIETEGSAAFPRLHDPRGPFMVKDAYVFVIDPRGVELVNPAFPNLEGRSVLDVVDTAGTPLVREMLGVAQTRGAGWIDYLWPRPGESASTVKSTYVRTARVGDGWLLVASGVYLADAPTQTAEVRKPTAAQLIALVREGATVLAQRGEAAFPELRERGSRWFHDGTYFLVYDLDGTRVFHAADRSLEGKRVTDARDALGRPYGRMFLEVAASPTGEGWVHYMYPEPGSLFPEWKSTFLKRVPFPSGETKLVGAGIYQMDMDEAFIEDVVERAAALIAAQGARAFPRLRDRTGPFYFMDTYVFVERMDGLAIVNAGMPSIEGRNILGLRDASGKALVRDYLDLARARGAGWVEYQWPRPGSHEPARKRTYVRAIQIDGDAYVVGSGFYPPG